MSSEPSNPLQFRPEDRERRSDTQYFELGPFTWRLSMRSPAWPVVWSQAQNVTLPGGHKLERQMEVKGVRGH